MRRFLDGLYRLSGVLAGLFIVAITLVILVQIVSRWMGFIVPSTDDLSGFFLAASSFLGLAYTLKKRRAHSSEPCYPTLINHPTAWARIDGVSDWRKPSNADVLAFRLYGVRIMVV